MYVFKIKVKPCAPTWRATQTCAVCERHKQWKPWTWLSFFFLFFFLVFWKLKQPLQTVWHTKAAAMSIIMTITKKKEKKRNKMMIKFLGFAGQSTLDNGQTSVPAAAAVAETERERPWKDQRKKRLKKEQQGETRNEKWETRTRTATTNLKASSGFLWAKADQEMQEAQTGFSQANGKGQQE